MIPPNNKGSEDLSSVFTSLVNSAADPNEVLSTDAINKITMDLFKYLGEPIQVARRIDNGDPNILRYYGTHVEEDGSRYKGEFFNTLYDGKGKLTLSNGSVYEGEFRKGLYHGKGKIIDALGRFYEGDFFEGKRHGQGKASNPDGSSYEGKFFQDRSHGQGKLIHLDGSAYEGEFFRGWFHGKGKMIRPNGTIAFEGEFLHGEPISKQSAPTPSRKISPAEALEQKITPLFKERKWEPFWKELNQLSKKSWSDTLWEKALLATLLEEDFEKTQKLYNELPKKVKNIEACSFALAYISYQNKDPKNALKHLNKVRKEYDSWDLFKKIEAGCSLKPEPVAQPPKGAERGPLSAQQPAQEPAHNGSGVAAVTPLSKNERRKLARAHEKVKTRGTPSSSSSLSLPPQTAPNPPINEPGEITVRDDREVIEVLNELVKKLPLIPKGERTVGSHKTLVYEINGQIFCITFSIVHGNQEMYAVGTGKEIGKNLWLLRAAGEKEKARLDELQMIKRNENQALRGEGLKPLASRQLMEMAMDNKVGRLVRKVTNLTAKKPK